MANSVLAYILILTLTVGGFLYKINVLEKTINEKDSTINDLTSIINKKIIDNGKLKIDNELCNINLKTSKDMIVDINKAIEKTVLEYEDKVIKLNKKLRKKPKVIYKREFYKDDNCTKGLELNKAISEFKYENYKIH